MRKQECGWQGVQEHSIKTYPYHLTFGLLAYHYLQKVKLQTRSGVFALRRRLISRGMTLNRDDLNALLDTAAWALRNLSHDKRKTQRGNYCFQPGHTER